MERFWIFLEAMAGLLEKKEAVDMLARDLSKMSRAERERMDGYLAVVIDKLPRLARKD